jgi:hypothetical protein
MRFLLIVFLTLAASSASADQMGPGTWGLIEGLDGGGTVFGDLNMRDNQICWDFDGDGADDCIDSTAEGLIRFLIGSNLQFRLQSGALSMVGADIDLISNFMRSSTQCTEIGGNASTTHSLGVGDVCLVDALEVPGVIYADGDIEQGTAKGAVTQITTSTESLTFANDASKTTSGLIPDGAWLMAVTTRVTTAGAGCTDVDIGDGTTVNLFADAAAVADGTTTDNSNAQANFANPVLSATEVTVTANGGNCTAGVWAVTAHYIDFTAATTD